MKLSMPLPRTLNVAAIEWLVWMRVYGGEKYTRVADELRRTLTYRERIEATKQMKCERAKKWNRKRWR